jgi:hypothetical protein
LNHEGHEERKGKGTNGKNTTKSRTKAQRHKERQTTELAMKGMKDMKNGKKK